MRKVAWLLPAALLAIPADALAAQVFLNGVRVDGSLSSTKLEKCGVEFDAKGNVLLNCPGIKVEGQQTAPGTGAAAATGSTIGDDDRPAALTKKYFLVTEQAVQGNTDFDIDLFINAKHVRTLRNNEEQIVTEVTKHLTPGKNTITFVAHKKKGEQRHSFSPEHFFRIIIGEGNAAGDKVMIDNPVVTFKKTAAETEDETKDVTLVTR